MNQTENFLSYLYEKDPDDMYFSSVKYFDNGLGIIVDIYYRNIIELYHKKGDVIVYTLTNHRLDDEYEFDLDDKKSFNILQVDEINSFIESIKNSAKTENSADISELIVKKALLFAEYVKLSPKYGKMNDINDQDVVNEVGKIKKVLSELTQVCNILIYPYDRSEKYVRGDGGPLPTVDYILNNTLEDF